MHVVQSWIRQQLQKRQKWQTNLTLRVLIPRRQQRPQMLMLSLRTSQQSWHSSQSRHGPACQMQVVNAVDVASCAASSDPWIRCAAVDACAQSCSPASSVVADTVCRANWRHSTRGRASASCGRQGNRGPTGTPDKLCPSQRNVLSCTSAPVLACQAPVHVAEEAQSQGYLLTFSQGAHPLVEADEAANPLTATASAAASVPGTDAGPCAETASEVMRAALAAEAEEVKDLAQKVWLCFNSQAYCGDLHIAAVWNCSACSEPDSKQSTALVECV